MANSKARLEGWTKFEQDNLPMACTNVLQSGKTDCRNEDETNLSEHEC